MQAFLKATIEDETKRTLKKPWLVSKRAKGIIAFALIAIMLVSIFAFLPKENQTPAIVNVNNTGVLSPTPSATNKPNALSDLSKILNSAVTSVTHAIAPPKGPGVIESAQTIDKTVWKAVGANAWNYFKPDVGVDSSTGLPSAGFGWPFFTDWDLGVYIQAVIDAQKLHLIDETGDWGSNARLDKVLTFLETRELNNYGYPFWFYNATDGKNYPVHSDLATAPVDGADTGRLFVALNNLRVFNGSLAPRINNIVLYGRSNYAILVPNIMSDSYTSTNIYAYYIYSGFASFWPENLTNVPSRILDNIFSAGNVTSDGVSLPKAAILGDPLLCSVFELNSNDSRLIALARQFYLAHEAKYNVSGKYVAFSEGNSYNNGYIYEWMVRSDGELWKIMAAGTDSYLDINPVIYNKVAFSFLSLYNTTFARSIVVYLEQSLPPLANGYSDGADYNIDIASRNLVLMVGDLTNGLILEAALYAIQSNP